MKKTIRELGRAILLAAAVTAIYLCQQELLRQAPYGSGAAWACLLAGVLAAVLAIRPVPAKGSPRRGPAAPPPYSIIAGGLSAGTAVTGAYLSQKNGMELYCLLFWSAAIVCFFVARWRPIAGRQQGESPSPGVLNVKAGVETYFFSPAVRTVLLVLFVALSLSAVKLNIEKHHLAAAILWAAGVIGMAPVWTGRGRPAHRGCKSGSGLVWAAFALILILAAAARFVAIDSIPGRINPDEGRQGRLGATMLSRSHARFHPITEYPGKQEREPFRVWGKKGFPDLFGIGWNEFPNIGYSIQALSFQFAGVSLRSLRWSSAFIGTLCLVPFFLWARRWWGGRGAVIATVLLACNGYCIGWSRLGLNAIHSVLTTTLVLWATARALTRGRRTDYVLVGICLGFTFHVYHAARLAIVATGLFWLSLAFMQPGFARRTYRHLLAGLLALLVTVGPMLATQLTNDKAHRGFEHRFKGNDIARWLVDTGEARRRENLGRQILGPLCLPTILSTNGWAFEGPLLHGVMAVLFYIGLGLICWDWYRPKNLLLVIWTSTSVIMGGMLFNWEHVVPHYVFALPVFCAVAALPLVEFMKRADNLQPHRLRPAAGVVVAVVIAACVWQNTEAYFVDYASKQEKDTLTFLGFLTGQAPAGATLYTLGVDHYPREPNVAKWDCLVERATPLSIVNWGNGMQLLPLRPLLPGDVMVVGLHEMTGAISTVERLYPRAASRLFPPESTSARSPAQVKVCTVTREELRAAQGLRSEFTLPEAGPVQVPPSPPTNEFSLPADLRAKASFPLEAKWSGFLHAPRFGLYGLRLRSTSPANLTVDGLRIFSGAGEREATVLLAAGLHEIRLSTRLRNADDSIRLLWKPPGGGTFRDIPLDRLCPWQNAPGLLAKGFAGKNELFDEKAWQSPPDLLSLDIIPCYYWFPSTGNLPVPRPLQRGPISIQWSGELKTKTAGRYEFQTRGNLVSAVWIDDELVVPSTTESNPNRHRTKTTGEIFLQPGPHRLLIRGCRKGSGKDQGLYFQLYWRPPGEQMELVPETVLTPDREGIITLAGKSSKAGT